MSVYVLLSTFVNVLLVVLRIHMSVCASYVVSMVVCEYFIVWLVYACFSMNV